MKNLKINTKFIVCFGLILVLFLVSVIATCSGIAISKNGYQNFYEEEGRRYFLLYLKLVINGTGNYYIEAQTRNMERTDVIVDYNREQFIIEMKIWRGNAYNERGGKQLKDYLSYYHLDKGYMLSFKIKISRLVLRKLF